MNTRHARFRHACLVAATTTSLLVTAASSVAAQEETAAADPTPERVLFVGNSHTARHTGLDRLVESFVQAEETARAFDGESMTEGGTTLEYHWNNGARNRIRKGGFDTVVLQGYLSGAETRTIEPFVTHARLLHGEIREAGAETVFFMTWPRGWEEWSDIEDAIEAHRLVESELGASVAPAAIAFEMAQAERPDLELIGPDKVHATWDGAYLAAATVYATLFDRSPEGLPYSFGMDPDDAAFLQRIAWQAVTEWHAGTESIEPTEAAT